jgi:hypothetical protein
MDTSGGGGGSEGGGGSGGAQGTGGAGGTNGVCPVPPGPNRDADRDGIIDVFDPDDDNDGRSDIAECWPGAQRFVNPGFELPANVGVSYATYREVPGWKSDSADGSIEVWSSGFRNVLAPEGRQFIEVHQFDPDTISQEIVTIPGSTLRWAFFHRGRQTTDTLELWIGAPGNTVLQRTFRTDNTQWVLYEGEYTVPAGQSQTRFEYRGILPYSGYGNFVDNADAEPICTVDTDRDGCVDSEDPN